MKPLKYLQGMLTFLMMVSCSHNLDLSEVFKQETYLKLSIYSNNKIIPEIISQDSICNNSEKWGKLLNWLSENSMGWRSSIASYSNPDLSLIGKNFRLLIYKNGVVIGFTNQLGEEEQMVKDINESEFNFLTIKN